MATPIILLLFFSKSVGILDTEGKKIIIIVIIIIMIIIIKFLQNNRPTNNRPNRFCCDWWSNTVKYHMFYSFNSKCAVLTCYLFVCAWWLSMNLTTIILWWIKMSNINDRNYCVCWLQLQHADQTHSSVTTQAAVSQQDGSVTVTMTVVICLMNKTAPAAAAQLHHLVNTSLHIDVSTPKPSAILFFDIR